MEHDRLNRVEERIAWLERHVVNQDRAMHELSEEVLKLQREIALLRGRLGAAEPVGDTSLSADDRPPHY